MYTCVRVRESLYVVMPFVQVDMELKNRMRQEREAKKALASHGHTDAARRDPSFEEIDAEIGQLTKSIQELLQAAQTQKTHRLSLSCDKVAQAVDRLTELFLPVGAHADRQTDRQTDRPTQLHLDI